MSIYHEQQMHCLRLLHELRMARLARLGISTREVRELDQGGEYDIIDLLNEHGLPEIAGRRERELLNAALDNSRAIGVIAY